MKHKETFLILIIMLLAGSCNNGKMGKGEAEIVDFGDGAKFEAIQSRIADVSYLPLETNDSSLFSTAGKVLFRDGMIYVGDFTIGKICVFDSEGKCQLVINSVGRGPGEYAMIRSFTVDDHYIDVMDLMLMKLLRYDKKTGRFAESLDLTVFAYDVESLGNGDFIFCYVPLQGTGKLPFNQSAHRVFITDSKLNIKKRMIEYSPSGFDLIGGLRSFSVSDDKISLLDFQNDDYYVFNIEDGRMLEKVHVVFSNPIPETLQYDASALNAGFSFMVSSPFLCGNYVSLMAKVGDGGGFYEYDFSTGKLLSNAEHEMGTFFYNIVGSHDGSFVGLITGWSSNYDSFIERGFKRADPASETAIRSDDPVLIFYNLK